MSAHQKRSPLLYLQTPPVYFDALCRRGRPPAQPSSETTENAPAEVVREVALEPASPTPAGETYEQHLARARSPRRPPPQNAAGDDDSGDEIIKAAAARWPPPAGPRPAATSGDASRPPPPAATVCKPCAPDGASEDPRRHHATCGRAYEI